LGNISAPTLLLTPGSSFHTPREQQDLMLRKIPDARQKIYHDGKHSDYYLRPDLLAQDTLEFIRSVNAKQKG
jgi:pimeloyl-ACP methyl ester carboxylesterase